jgi:hypothetical protein
MTRHFSASQINTFLNEPALWVLQAFYGVRPEVGAGAWRGNAIEAAMDWFLYKPDANDDDLYRVAMRRFEQDAEGELSDDVEKERQTIADTLNNLMPWLREQELPTPTGTQMKIEWVPDGTQTPVIGYVDYLWTGEDYTDLWDLKAPGRAPSFDKETGLIKDKQDHLRQVAIYWQARGIKPALLYAMPAKNKAPILYRPSDAELNRALSEVKAAVRAMERLARNDADTVAPLYPPKDVSGFRWDSTTQNKAAEIWGLEVA